MIIEDRSLQPCCRVRMFWAYLRGQLGYTWTCPKCQRHFHRDDGLWVPDQS